MKVLVTGGAGFIGSHITDALIAKGHKVVIVDNLSTGKNSNINPEAKFYLCDLKNTKKLSEVLSKERVDIVIHHAAQIDVRKSVADPVYDANINIIGTLNLLENAVKAKVKKVIFASSGGTIYGECGKYPPDETAKGQPLSPYGITKYTVEFYLNYYSAIHGLNFTALRYGNVYGPRQDPHGEAGVVAIFAGKMIAGEGLRIFGDGRQMRDYVYVKDVAKANVLALTKGHNQIINIGIQQAISVNTLFNRMARICKYKMKPQYMPARPGELFRSVLCNKKAKRILNWAPSLTLDEGLKHTIEFFE